MSSVYNIYCDESCHLENDGQDVMLLGCVWSETSHARKLAVELRKIKESHHVRGELKWTRVSRSRLDFFLNVIDWFFGSPDLHFRVLVVKNKAALDHAAFNKSSHDVFYYKMYFSLLNKIISPTESYNVYIDIKDTRSKIKVQDLREILCNDQYDFTGEMIAKIQQVRSHEVELLQLADFLIGATSYRHRDLHSSDAKLAIINRIEEKKQATLLHSTALSEQKFNVFVFTPRIGEGDANT